MMEIQPSRSIERSKFLIGHGILLLYLLFSIVAYKLRFTHFDAAYYFFHVVNYEEVFVKHRRFINYITQALPLVGVKLGASLKTCMMLYSISFGILFYSAFLWITYKLKNINGGLLLACALTLSIRYKHFAGHTEIVIALVASVVFLCQYWYNLNSKKDWYWISTLVLCFLLFCIHPVVVFPMMVVLGIDMSHHHRWQNPRAWLQICLLLIFFGFRFSLVAMDPYESNKVGLLSQLIEVFQYSKEKYIWIVFRKYLFDEFYLVHFTFFFLLTLHFIKKKEWLTFTLIHLGHLSLLLLLLGTYSYIGADVFMMFDGYFGMFGLLWGYVLYLAWETLSSEFQRYVLWTTIVLITLSILLIGISGRFMAHREIVLRTTFAKNANHDKLLLAMDRFDWNELWYPYQVPYETLLLTSLSSPQESKTLFVDFDYKGVEALRKHRSFLGYYNSTDLNPFYFGLKPSEYFVIDRIPEL